MARLQKTPRLDLAARWLARLESSASPPERVVRPGLRGLPDRALCLCERTLHGRWARPLRDALKVLLVTVREYLQDQCSAHAGALSFNTLIAAIPLSALLAFLFKSLFPERFGQLQQALLGAFLPDANREVGLELMEKVASGVDVVGRGLPGLAALGILLWAGHSLLTSVDETLNHIWESDQPRSFTKRAGNFVMLLFVSVLGLTLLSTLSSLAFAGAPPARMLIALAETLLPVYFLYRFVPVAKVRGGPAFMSALGVALGVLAMRSIVNYYVAKIFSHSPLMKVYGSLALMPITLLVIWLFWQLTLIGAELAFSIQHRDRIFGHWARRREEQDLVLRFQIFTEICRRSVQGEAAPRASELSLLFSLPKAKGGDILDDFVEAGLVQPGRGDDPDFIPKPNLRHLTAVKVLETLLRRSVQSGAEENRGARGAIAGDMAGLLARFETAFEKEFGAQTMEELTSPGSHVAALLRGTR